MALSHQVLSRWAHAPTIATKYDRTRNSFTPLRLVLACMVLYAHSFAISGVLHRDQLYRLTDGAYSMGRFAVLGFFVISGFLVTQSLATTGSRARLFAFLRKRALRIWPALIVCTLLVAFVLSGVLTRRQMSGFYSFEGGWSPWWYSFDSITFNLFSNLLGWHTRVRDLFAGNPMNATTNGSLWSIRFEVSMYLILAATGALLRYRMRAIVLVGASTAVLGLILLRTAGVTLPHPEYWVFKEWPTFIDLAPYFFIGGALYVFRYKVPYSVPAAVSLGFIFLLASVTKVGFVVALIAIPYALLIAAISPRFSGYERRLGDYSYGVYIYAWPVQQTVVFLTGTGNPYSLFVMALPLTLLCAIGSWHLVERPLLRRKPRSVRSALDPRATSQPAV